MRRIVSARPGSGSGSGRDRERIRRDRLGNHREVDVAVRVPDDPRLLAVVQLGDEGVLVVLLVEDPVVREADEAADAAEVVVVKPKLLSFERMTVVMKMSLRDSQREIRRMV